MIESEKDSGKKNALSPSANDKYQFTLAVIIVAPFVGYVEIFYGLGMTAESKEILGTLGVFVGTIIGFYFAQRPIQNLTKEIVEITSDKKDAIRTLRDSDRLDGLAERKIEQLEADLKEKEQFIESLKSRYGV
jgi:uncharacterized protein YneF (UPF0154 family)